MFHISSPEYSDRSRRPERRSHRQFVAPVSVQIAGGTQGEAKARPRAKPVQNVPLLEGALRGQYDC